MDQLSVQLRGSGDFLQKGCSGLLAYISDIRVEATRELSRVPIVRNFPDVFPMNFQ